MSVCVFMMGQYQKFDGVPYQKYCVYCTQIMYSNANQPTHRFAGDLDVLLAGHEDEDVALVLREVHLDGLLDGGVDVVLDVVLGVEDVDGEGAAGDGEAGDVAEEVGELLRVHRGRRDDQLQVGPAGDH